MDKAVGLAEAALGLARANNELLKRLQEEVGELRQGQVSTPDEDGDSQAHGSPLEEPGSLKESPGGACRTVSATEEECDGVGSGVQVVLEQQLGAALAVGPGPLGFPAAQRDGRLPGCTPAASEGAPVLNPVSILLQSRTRVLLLLSAFPGLFLFSLFLYFPLLKPFFCLYV